MAPPNVSVQYVENPDDALVEQAVRVFSDLMTENRAAIAFTGGNIALLGNLGRAMMRPTAFKGGDMFAATDDKGDLVGFTLWLPPRLAVLSTEEERQLGYNEFLEKLSDEGKVYFPEVVGKEFPQVIDGFTGITSTALNTYWCDFAFVRADYQGKGVAKALFKLAFDNAKAKGYTTLGLATTNIRNVEIYRRIGFELKSFKEMPSPWGSWPAWSFIRERKET